MPTSGEIGNYPSVCSLMFSRRRFAYMLIALMPDSYRKMLTATAVHVARRYFFPQAAYCRVTILASNVVFYFKNSTCSSISLSKSSLSSRFKYIRFSNVLASSSLLLAIQNATGSCLNAVRNITIYTIANTAGIPYMTRHI